MNENLTIWASDFQNITVPITQQATFFLTLVLLRSLKQKENLKWNWYTLICFSPTDFPLKITFLFYVAWTRFMGKPGVPVARRCTTGTNFYITVRKLLIGKTQLIYLANNVHLVLNTYRCLFFSNCYWEPSMLFDSFDHVMLHEFARQDSVEMTRFWNLQHSKFLKQNGVKMVDVWNCQQTYRRTDQNGSR